MRSRLLAVGLSLLTVLVTVIVFGFNSQAATIPVAGLDGTDAIVTDRNGNVIKDTSTLSRWEEYAINYHWSIEDGEPVAAGDTAIVTLPDGASAIRNLSFNLKDADGLVIGTFTIKEGEKSGTITFNDRFSSIGTNRDGTLNFFVEGTTSNETHYDWLINKNGWISDFNDQGQPTTLMWNVAFNPLGKPLGQVTVTDTLSGKQAFIPTSVQATTGTYNEAGNFVSSGQIVPQVTVSGQTITFHFSDVHTAVNMTYQTTLTEINAGKNTAQNSATLDGVTVGGNVSWGGSGTGGGTGTGGGDGHESPQKTGIVQLIKSDAATGAKLAGAVYELRDSQQQVLQTGLKTDTNGKLTIVDLEPGAYQLIETQAPLGYVLNDQPIPFRITDSTTIVHVAQTDKPKVVPPKLGQVTLTKVANGTETALSGAAYELRNHEGVVVKTDLTTDAHGQLTVTDLKPGTYQFIEIKAPVGYELNATPVTFTIVADQTAAVAVTAKDTKTPGTDPSGPTGPETPTNPEQPGEPTGPETPTGPTQPGEPTKPIEPTTPSEPEQPVNPGQPGEPTKPTEPTTPSEPEQPVKPGQPSQPIKPIAPGLPGQPQQPGQPLIPIVPIKPEKPTKPAQPEQPTKPNRPDQSTIPTIPGQTGATSAVEQPGSSTTTAGSTDASANQPLTPGTQSNTGVTGVTNANGSTDLPQTDERSTVNWQLVISVVGIWGLVIGYTWFKHRH